MVSAATDEVYVVVATKSVQLILISLLPSFLVAGTQYHIGTLANPLQMSTFAIYEYNVTSFC